MKALIEKKQKLVAEYRSMVEAYKADGKMPADKQADADKMWAAIEEVSGEIESRNSYASRLVDLEKAAANDSQIQHRNVSPTGGKETASKDDALKVQRSKAFSAYLRHGSASYGYHEVMNSFQPTAEQRALLADTLGAGGDLLPPAEFIDQIIIPRDKKVWMRQFATVKQLTTSGDGWVPTIETNPEDADWTTEVASAVEDDEMTTGKRELKPRVLTKLVKISAKELQLRPDVQSIVGGRLGYKFGVTEEKAFLVGTGVTDADHPQPLGIFNATATGHIPTTQDVCVATGAAKPLVITMDGVYAVKYKLAPEYWPNARWVMNPTILQVVATIKDEYGRYLWQPNQQIGQPDILAGFPVHPDSFAPGTIASGTYTMVLGDFSYYWIAELTGGFTVQRLNELYAANNLVGFIGREYVDGMPVLAEAFVRGQMGTGT